MKRLIEFIGTLVVFVGAGLGIVAGAAGWLLWSFWMPLAYWFGSGLDLLPWPGFLLLWLAGFSGAALVSWAVLKRFSLGGFSEALGFVGLGGVVLLGVFGFATKGLGLVL